ncbi:MAG TPA: hypothetical protein VGP72_23855 [Planctomycetota bacterium]|jgi:hypothetical protein
MRNLALSVLLLVCAGAWCSTPTGIPADELDKQTDFKRAYASREKDDHLKALQGLEGCTHPTTWEILATVVRVDQFPDVRLAAYRMLSLMPARDESLSRILVDFFQSLKLNDVDTRCDYVKYMANSEFKYSVTEAMCDYGANRLTYPDFRTANRDTRNSPFIGDPNVNIKKRREEFEKYVEAFNAATKATITAKNDTAPKQFKTWWSENKDKLYRADKALVDKFRQEDLAARNKNNPLLPKSDKEKTSDKADSEKKTK